MLVFVCVPYFCIPFFISIMFPFYYIFTWKMRRLKHRLKNWNKKTQSIYFWMQAYLRIFQVRKTFYFFFKVVGLASPELSIHPPFICRFRLPSSVRIPCTYHGDEAGGRGSPRQARGGGYPSQPFHGWSVRGHHDGADRRAQGKRALLHGDRERVRYRSGGLLVPLHALQGTAVV